MENLEIINIDRSMILDGSYRKLNADKSKGISIIAGKLKKEPLGDTVIQSYIFADRWEREDALKWVEDNGDMTALLLGNNKIINLGEETMDNRLNEGNPKIAKMFSCENKDFDDTKMTFTATASTEDKDRDGDVLVASGWKVKNYKKNPVVLWQHNADLMPVAKADDVWVDGGKLKFKPTFAPAEINPFARQVYLAYKKGYLTSFSVRFDPIEWEDIIEEGKDQQTLMRRGRKFKSHELLEISAVNIPANPQATKSADLVDFIVKSYMFENKSDINIDIDELYAKADDTLKVKIDKLMELREMKEAKIKSNSIKEISIWIDNEVKKLESELEIDRKTMQLSENLKELQSGITRLIQK